MDTYNSKFLYHWFTRETSNHSSVDGLRLDSAINVDVDFFTSFTKAAGVFATGEVLSGLTTDVCPYQATIGSVLNYPLYVTHSRLAIFKNSRDTDISLSPEHSVELEPS